MPSSPSLSRRLDFALVLLAPAILTVLAQHEGDLRLDGYGASSLAGRLEIFLRGEWGTVCGDREFNPIAAKVACRQLGLGHAVGYHGTPFLRYGAGNGSIWLEQVRCHDNDSHLLRCRHREVENSSCGHHMDVAVMCCSLILWPFGSLQLVGGAGSFGELRVDTDNHFRPLCDEYFTMKEANVACRQLGYSGAVRVVPNSVFGSVITDRDSASLLDFTFHCNGDEDHLLACARHSISSTVCRSGLDEVAIQCASADGIREVRLVDSDGGDSSARGEGRVEVVLSEGGEWGTVCGEGFGNFSAQVVCRQLGFSAVGDVQIGSYGAGSGPIHLSFLQCTGFEDGLENCSYTLAGPNCTHSHDVRVNCSSTLPQADGTLRLVDSSLAHEGRLEISYHGFWMTVCGRLFTQEAADVACRQLGFEAAGNFCQNACMGSGADYIHFAEYRCNGDERGLNQCRHEVFNVALCDHQWDVGLSCVSLPATIQPSGTSPSSPSTLHLPPSLSTGTSGTTATLPPSQPGNSPPGNVSPSNNDSFLNEALFYVIIAVLCLLVLALIAAVTICCVCKKKHAELEPTLPATNHHSNNTGASPIGGEETGSEFDFDALAEGIELKECSKAAQAAMPEDAVSLTPSSVPGGPPPTYDELEFLSHTIPEKTKEPL